MTACIPLLFKGCDLMPFYTQPLYWAFNTFKYLISVFFYLFCSCHCFLSVQLKCLNNFISFFAYYHLIMNDLISASLSLNINIYSLLFQQTFYYATQMTTRNTHQLLQFHDKLWGKWWGSVCTLTGWQVTYYTLKQVCEGREIRTQTLPTNWKKWHTFF